MPASTCNPERRRTSQALCLLHLLQNHFVSRATKLPRQALVLSRPPPSVASDDDQRARSQDSLQRLQPIAAEIQENSGLHAALAHQYAKASLVPLQQHWRAGKRE